MRGGQRVGGDDDWRSERAYDYVEDLDPTELAWEFLRRNPAYQAAYKALTSRNSATDEDKSALAAHWGLRSPGRPPPLRPASADILVRPRQSRRDPADTWHQPKCAAAYER